MDLRRLLMQSLVWRGIYFITTFLLIIFLSRYLEAGGAGWVFYLTFFFSLISLVGSLSMESAITFYASNGKIEPPKLVWLSFVWTILVGILAFIGLSIYFGELRNENAITQKQYLFYAITYICGILLTNFFTSLFYAERNFFLPNLIMSILNLGLVFIILYQDLFGFSVNEVLNIYFGSFLAQGILLFIAFMIRSNSWRQISIPIAAENKMLFRYALVALSANVVFFLVYRADYWFVRHSSVSSGADLGNYIQVSKLGQMFLIVPQILASVVFPQTASGINREQVNRNIMVISRILTLMFVGAFVFVLFFGKQLFPFVFGPSFDNMYLPMLLLMPGILSLSILVLLSAYFAGKGNVAVNFRGALIALVFVIVCNALFVDKYGIYAAAIISSVGYSVNLLYALRQFYKDYDIGLKEFFTWRKSDFMWMKQLMISKEKAQ